MMHSGPTISPRVGHAGVVFAQVHAVGAHGHAQRGIVVDDVERVPRRGDARQRFGLPVPERCVGDLVPVLDGARAAVEGGFDPGDEIRGVREVGRDGIEPFDPTGALAPP